MDEVQHLSGQCLCGAVQITATASNPILRACHCDMCRQHTSGMFVSISADPDSISVEGPAKSFRSSEWAERGFCPECGSTLWYGTVHDGVKNLSAGLFKGAADAPMKLEFFTDNCPQGYALAGTHKKLSTQETIALFAPQEGEA
ncbi:GFA family protein [Sulfitobacter mediterraneus]|uniref:Glutathione-dependent formaldehyde-activating protein n=1 Tax=Sulfitobacter mediterraneus TaxID=83219 RepID=A0A061SQ47_9RHOB|nr:GFA family protein [Sulfitobacter mediterraneus]KAJ03821.1 glutathione-dependent formaldehyde-activating protein [Sulfitobacter mediterraneus]